MYHLRFEKILNLLKRGSKEFKINYFKCFILKFRTLASLEELKNLNPYVNIQHINRELTTNDLNFLKEYNCVILTEIFDLDLLVKANELCRENNINFLIGNVNGLFAYSFTDFGSNFEVLDPDAEDYKELFISKITNESECLIETMDQRPHNLENDDLVKLNEIEGLNQLNNQIYKVSKIINSHKFTLNVNTSEMPKYTRGGLFKKIKKQLNVQYDSLKNQLLKPELLYSDFNQSKYSNPLLIHILYLALSDFCKLNSNDFETFLNIVKEKSLPFKSDISIENLKNLCRIFYFTREYPFPPLSAIYGGILAQEALKSITNKFVPIKQWLYLDSSELFELNPSLSVQDIQNVYSNLFKKDRYDVLRGCFGGETSLYKLFKTKLFMVGCGAIGCEMLKNYALLGIASNSIPNENGLITITDNDLIEKSNLNRQFLFRQKDIQRPKSVVAAESIRTINPYICIKTHETKVCPQSENDFFTDKFFRIKICV